MHPSELDRDRLNEADDLALTAYELKSICAMLKCHPDFERGNSIVHYAYHKVSDVINKLEGL